MTDTATERPGLASGDAGGGPRRRRALTGVLVAVLVVVLVAGAGVWLSRREPPPGPARPPTGAPASGVFRGTDLAEVKAFERWRGRPVDYVVDWSTRDTWEQIANPQLLLDEWRGTGYRVVHGLAMLPEEDPSATIEAGARGEYDRWYTELARRLVEGGQADAVLRLGWEFNLDSSRWHTDDPEAFTAYWRRVVTAMRSVPGQRFAFDWSVNNGPNAVDAAEFWPGDDVVDYVGVDVYDVSWKRNTYPYPEDCDAGCRAERQDRAWAAILGDRRGLRFWAGFAAEHGKQLSIPEWGVWDRPDGHGGGENPRFVTRMHDFIMSTDVAYEAYFEYSAGDGPHRLMDAFPASGAEYRRLFGSR